MKLSQYYIRVGQSILKRKNDGQQIEARRYSAQGCDLS